MSPVDEFRNRFIIYDGTTPKFRENTYLIDDLEEFIKEVYDAGVAEGEMYGDS